MLCLCSCISGHMESLAEFTRRRLLLNSRNCVKNRERREVCRSSIELFLVAFFSVFTFVA